MRGFFCMQSWVRTRLSSFFAPVFQVTVDPANMKLVIALFDFTISIHCLSSFPYSCRGRKADNVWKVWIPVHSSEGKASRALSLKKWVFSWSSQCAICPQRACFCVLLCVLSWLEMVGFVTWSSFLISLSMEDLSLHPLGRSLQVLLQCWLCMPGVGSDNA